MLNCGSLQILEVAMAEVLSPLIEGNIKNKENFVLTRVSIGLLLSSSSTEFIGNLVEMDQEHKSIRAILVRQTSLIHDPKLKD